MLSKDEQERLALHTITIFHSIILPEITPKGCILVIDERGNTSPDYVTTHHLVESCLELDPLLTRSIVNGACTWFAKNESLQNPFLLTTLARTKQLSKKGTSKIIDEFSNNCFQIE